jgi:hypothetical protein
LNQLRGLQRQIGVRGRLRRKLEQNYRPLLQARLTASRVTTVIGMLIIVRLAPSWPIGWFGRNTRACLFSLTLVLPSCPHGPDPRQKHAVFGDSAQPSHSTKWNTIHTACKFDPPDFRPLVAGESVELDGTNSHAGREVPRNLQEHLTASKSCYTSSPPDWDYETCHPPYSALQTGGIRRL